MRQARRAGRWRRWSSLATLVAVGAVSGSARARIAQRGSARPAIVLGLRVAGGELPSDLVVELSLKNSAAVPQRLPIASCATLDWPAFVTLFVRVDRGPTFRLGGATLTDVASLHPHGPLSLAAHEERRQRIALREAAERPARARDRALSRALIAARTLELWAELRAARGLRLRSAHVRATLRIPVVESGARVAPGAPCYTHLVAGAEAAACVLTRGGTPWCWGEQPPGRPPSGRVLAAAPLLQLERAALELAMAGATLCARTSRGAIYCASAPSRHAPFDSSDQSRFLRRVAGLPPLRALQPGRRGHCGWERGEGRAWCWDPAVAWTAEVTQLSDACALRHDGGVLCRGSAREAAPLPVAGLGNTIIALDSGQRRACALRRDGQLLCWPLDAAAEAAATGTTGAPTPQRVAAIDDAVQLFTGDEQTCVTRKDGTLWCLAAPPLPALQVPVSGSVTQVVFASASTCARTAEGTVWCWKGGGARSPRRLSVPNTQSLAAAARLLCGLTMAGSVWCLRLDAEQARPQRIGLPRRCDR